MAESDLDVIRRGYVAFGSGDVEELHKNFHEDATWVVPGKGPVSGTKQGRDAVLAYLGELMTRSEGTLLVSDLAFAEGDGYVFVRSRNRATRAGKSWDTTGINVFRVEDGKVVSVQSYFEDTTEADAFWG